MVIRSNRFSLTRTGGMLALGIGLACGLFPACTSYTNVPSPDNALAGQNPNARQPSAVALAGLEWVIARHPVQGRYVVNLPVGTSLETAQRFADELGPDAIIPGTAGTPEGTPIYHITRVWTRVAEGKVDVVYPITLADGSRGSRGITAWMKGGFQPWRVTRGQYWAPGTIEVPPIWVPIPQAELDAIAEAEAQAEAERREAERAQRRAIEQAESEEVVQPEGEPDHEGSPMEDSGEDTGGEG